MSQSHNVITSCNTKQLRHCCTVIPLLRAQSISVAHARDYTVPCGSHLTLSRQSLGLQHQNIPHTEDNTAAKQSRVQVWRCTSHTPACEIRESPKELHSSSEGRAVHCRSHFPPLSEAKLQVQAAEQHEMHKVPHLPTQSHLSTQSQVPPSPICPHSHKSHPVPSVHTVTSPTQSHLPTRLQFHPLNRTPKTSPPPPFPPELSILTLLASRADPLKRAALGQQQGHHGPHLVPACPRTTARQGLTRQQCRWECKEGC